MGYFRRLKKSRHTLEEVRKKCEELLAEIREACAEPGDGLLLMAVDEWAAWRELQARLEGDNQR